MCKSNRITIITIATPEILVARKFRVDASRAFTLVEVLIVVLIIAILAAAAMPRVVFHTAGGKDASALHSLNVIRQAIEQYAVTHRGIWPGENGVEADFKRDLRPYLQGPFPRCPVGAGNAQIVMQKTGIVQGETTPTKGWRYYYKRGEFIINFQAPVKTDPSIKYDDW